MTLTNMLSKRSQTQKSECRVTYFHDILEKTKLIWSDRKQISSQLPGVGGAWGIDCRGIKGTFGG